MCLAIARKFFLQAAIAASLLQCFPQRLALCLRNACLHASMSVSNLVTDSRIGHFLNPLSLIVAPHMQTAIARVLLLDLQA
jgi:hypothetical protein